MLTAGPGGVTEDPFSLLDRPVSQALPELTQAPLNSQLWGRATPRASEVSVLGVRELSAAEVAALPSNKAQRTPGAPLRAIAKVKARHHEIARLIAAFPDTVVGIKDSDGKIENMHAISALFPGFSVLAGADPLLLPVLQGGGAGCITATSNLVARELRFVFDHWQDPARAAEVKAASAPAVKTMSSAHSTS